MAAQFLRIEAFSAKQVMRICAEANRDEGFCSHVEVPKPPSWMIGCVEDVKNAVNEHMNTFTPIRHKSGRVSTRRRRADHRCLIGGVTSWPIKNKDFLKQDLIGRKRFQDWVWASKAWLETRFGENLIAMVAHADEGYLHLHFFVVGDANQLHPGLAAEFSEGVRLGSRLEKRVRYVAAMQNFLDEAHAEVGSKFDLERALGGKSMPRIKDRATYLQIRALREQIEAHAVPELQSNLSRIASHDDGLINERMVF